jgi:hypothetical protein
MIRYFKVGSVLGAECVLIRSTKPHFVYGIK